MSPLFFQVDISSILFKKILYVFVLSRNCEETVTHSYALKSETINIVLINFIFIENNLRKIFYSIENEKCPRVNVCLLILTITTISGIKQGSTGIVNYYGERNAITSNLALI